MSGSMLSRNFVWSVKDFLIDNRSVASCETVTAEEYKPT